MIVGLSIGGVGLVLFVLGLFVSCAGDHEMNGRGEGGDLLVGCMGVVLGRILAWVGGCILAVGVVVYGVARWNWNL